MMKASTQYHKIDPYGHCASLCRHKDGFLLAYYNGPECSDRQAVNIDYIVNDVRIAHARLPSKTGNCVLLNVNKEEAILIFSYFNDTDGVDKPDRPVRRWRFCSNWKIRIAYENNSIFIKKMEILDVSPMIGHLTRCAPIWLAEHEFWYLPIYHENQCHGVILRSRDCWNWKLIGKIGHKSYQEGIHGIGILIQPTIWSDGKKIHSLSRDITPANQAWYSYSEDVGYTWSEPIQVKVWNANNSIVAIHDNTDRPWLVWNHGKGRQALVLGRWDPKQLTAQPYLLLNQQREVPYINASYPNYYKDEKGVLHIVHTDVGMIARHSLDQETLNWIETHQPDNPNPSNLSLKILTREDVPGWTINTPK